MPPATQQSLADYALLTLLYFHSFFILFYFCPDSHKLLDNLLNVKQASDMPAVQKSRHRIDPDAIPSPVSLLSACLFLRFTLSSPLACTHSQLPPPPALLTPQSQGYVKVVGKKKKECCEWLSHPCLLPCFTSVALF